MIVKLEFESENGGSFERDPLSDEVIRAIDRVMRGANWARSENAWIASK